MARPNASSFFQIMVAQPRLFASDGVARQRLMTIAQETSRRIIEATGGDTGHAKLVFYDRCSENPVIVLEIAGDIESIVPIRAFKATVPNGLRTAFGYGFFDKESVDEFQEARRNERRQARVVNRERRQRNLAPLTV